eukprot:6215767-Amphidinium_carterae.1
MAPEAFMTSAARSMFRLSLQSIFFTMSVPAMQSKAHRGSNCLIANERTGSVPTAQVTLRNRRSKLTNCSQPSMPFT